MSASAGSKDSNQLFVQPEWAVPEDSDADAEVDQSGDASAVWALAHPIDSDTKMEAAVVRRDYYFAAEGFSSFGPQVEVTIGDNDASEGLTPDQARKLAKALLASADDLAVINAKALGRRVWRDRDIYVEPTQNVWAVVEATSLDGERSVSIRPFRDGEERVGTSWDSNSKVPRHDRSSPPAWVRTIVALAEKITPRGDNCLASYAEIIH
jgi:hypothetical protein